MSSSSDTISAIESNKTTTHLQILYGNIVEGGSVAEISGKEGTHFEGSAPVFDGEFELTHGIQSGRVKKGDVVVIRNVGAKARRVCPKMLKPTSAILAQV